MSLSIVSDLELDVVVGGGRSVGFNNSLNSGNVSVGHDFNANIWIYSKATATGSGAFAGISNTTLIVVSSYNQGGSATV